MFKKVLVSLIVLIFCFSISTISHAQTTIEPDDLFFTINPEDPEPGQLVRVALNSYVFSVDELYIEWLENSKIKLAGLGQKNFQFSAGNVGETKLITLTVREKPGGDVIFRKNIVSKPAGLDILWQAVDSYTPPFYKGKALPTNEGIVKIIALPDFQVGTKTVTPKNVIYNWKRNFQPVTQASGYGRSSISIKQSFLLDKETIGVTANEPTEGATAKGTLIVKPYNPKIIFYKKDPLLGVDFNNGIDTSTQLSKNDTTVLAIPYFVSPRNVLDPDLEYIWKLNNKEITTPRVKNQLVLRGSSEPGIASLELTVESAKKLFLTVKKTITLNLQ